VFIRARYWSLHARHVQSTAILENVTVPKLVNKIPFFSWKPKDHYRIHKTCHCSLTWVRWVQSKNSRLNSPKSILMLAFYLCPSNSPSFEHNNNIPWSWSLLKLHIMESSPASCHFLPLRSKYSPQHPVLRHPQSMFFCVWETKFHTYTKQHVTL